MKIIKSILILTFAAVAAVGCASSSNESSISPTTVSVPEYRTFLNELDVAVQQGVPREMEEDEINQVNALTSGIRRILEGHESIDTVSEMDRTRVFNMHENLQAVLLGDRASQVICRSERSTGTNFKTTSCMTRAEWDMRKQAVERLFNQGTGFGSSMSAPEGR
ncbi:MULTISPECIES: hypothetical protein [Gammaproteobacteria]|uniref:hypothetical protein n=1 Tax=Gammaproteobacteria TaxID=1236 RepID=UPI000DCFB239|nr:MULTISPECIES: hypothetical protein [Gammaproteobacteria]RTE85582.1 hypothetical protein DQX04_11825 [Aliidiomarina sp. B3213]TCZ89552.1 hypothetical protein EYQ95_11755 [Lysobacter sp. N42]